MNNCFLWRPDEKECSALKVRHMACGTRGCPFYKTEDEQIEQMERARKRCEIMGVPYGDDYAMATKKKEGK